MNLTTEWKEQFEAAMDAISDCDFTKAEEHLSGALRVVEMCGVSEAELEAILFHLAFILRQNDKHEDARHLYQRLLEMQEPLYGKRSLNVAQTLQEIGDSYHETDDYTRAEPYLRDVVEILESIDNTPILLLAEALDDLSFNCRMQRRFDEAELHARRSVQLYESYDGPESLMLVQPLMNYAIVLWELGQETEATQMEKRAKHLRDVFERMYPRVK